MYPALAVARALRDARSDVELAYLGGARGFEQRIVSADALGAGLPFHRLWVRSLRSGQRDVHMVLDPIRLGAAVPQAWALLARVRPAALFTTGGFLAVPIVMACRARGIPTLVWEGNVIPGRATRLLGRMATLVAVSFPPALRAFPGRSFVSGTPIRSFAGVDRAAARAAFGVAPDERLLLVFGGSQYVARLNAAVRDGLAELVRSWRVLHLAGEAGMGEAAAARRALPAELRERYDPRPFLADAMADALVAADLVVGRAGSSTCAELAAVGVASILVPYPFAGAHQRHNAEWLASQGAAVTVDDGDLDAARLLAETERLRDDARRAAMAEAARRLGRPAAARLLAEA
ncbi:MAG TPA: glycosyltransferase, partial [Candidatus Limnocylindria bacterium]|nr:glycosyltransferase [Candidatus Limnocylindria bacterium]